MLDGDNKFAVVRQIFSIGQALAPPARNLFDLQPGDDIEIIANLAARDGFLAGIEPGAKGQQQ